jgi:hypothetical protein
VRIAILVPTHDYVPALFAYDLAHLQAQTVAAFPPDAGVEVGLYFEVGTYTHKARESLLRQAVEDGAHYALFVDSDMRFPPDALLRLLEHGEAVVGANYSRRTFPADFVALKSPTEKLVTGPKSKGLEEVYALGLGLCLLETAALGRLPEGRWFWFDEAEDGQDIGEDVYFFRQLRAAGLTPYADHDLSKLCGHIGSFTFTTAHAVLEREA